jgi:hypothetical protein
MPAAAFSRAGCEVISRGIRGECRAWIDKPWIDERRAPSQVTLTSKCIANVGDLQTYDPKFRCFCEAIVSPSHGFCETI